MKDIELYTDGACSFNPGPGGWGIVMICDGKIYEKGGFCEHTTNNRMELNAVVEGLKKIKSKANVTIYTDSAYVHNAFAQDWIGLWLRKNWKNSENKPVANKDLWQELIALVNKHNVTWVKVKGHADNEFNNKCDKIATDQVAQFIKKTKFQK